MRISYIATPTVLLTSLLLGGCQADLGDDHETIGQSEEQLVLGGKLATVPLITESSSSDYRVTPPGDAPLDARERYALQQLLVDADLLGEEQVLKPIGIDGNWEVMITPADPQPEDELFLVAVSRQTAEEGSMQARPVGGEPTSGGKLGFGIVVAPTYSATTHQLAGRTVQRIALGSAGELYGKSFSLELETTEGVESIDNHGIYFTVPAQQPVEDPTQETPADNNAFLISDETTETIFTGQGLEIAEGDNTATGTVTQPIITKGKSCFTGKISLQTEDPIYIALTQTDLELNWCVSDGKVEHRSTKYDFWAADPSLALTTWYIDSAGGAVIWYANGQTEVCSQVGSLYHNDNFLWSVVERIYVRHRIKICGRTDGKFVYSWYHTPISTTGASHFVAEKFLSADVDVVKGSGILGAWRDSAL